MGGGGPRLGGDGKAVARGETVSHQPAVYHVSAGLPDEVVLEEVRILIQESLNLCQVRTKISVMYSLETREALTCSSL